VEMQRKQMSEFVEHVRVSKAELKEAQAKLIDAQKSAAEIALRKVAAVDVVRETLGLDLRKHGGSDLNSEWLAARGIESWPSREEDLYEQFMHFIRFTYAVLCEVMDVVQGRPVIPSPDRSTQNVQKLIGETLQQLTAPSDMTKAQRKKYVALPACWRYAMEVLADVEGVMSDECDEEELDNETVVEFFRPHGTDEQKMDVRQRGHLSSFSALLLSHHHVAMPSDRALRMHSVEVRDCTSSMPKLWVDV